MTKSQQLEELQTRVTEAIERLRGGQLESTRLVLIALPDNALIYLDSSVAGVIRDLRRALEASQ